MYAQSRVSSMTTHVIKCVLKMIPKMRVRVCACVRAYTHPVFLPICVFTVVVN